jgi:methanethiol oxidase
MSALGGANGNDGPGGVALIDHDTFEVIGPWEQDRGAQFFAYDVWWHLNYDTVVHLDDRWLYVSCWATGELKQLDVSDPFHPRQTASVRLGGIVRREPHPAAADLPLAGGPQMVEMSRNGQRVYVTNSLYGAWDEVFYPDGVGAWMAKLDADTRAGGLVPDSDFFPRGNDFRGHRVHQIRLQGGDASSDSYCFTS